MNKPSAAGIVPDELHRQLGVSDAVVIGLGSMIGAGIFAALAPAARAAGSGLLLGLALAAVVAYCNATSSARLAARYPASGGTYVYGRERLGDFWGYLAGWGFVVGKTASCAAMALTVGSYVWPGQAHAVAVAAVVALTAVNYAGVQKSALDCRSGRCRPLAVSRTTGVVAEDFAGQFLERLPDLGQGRLPGLGRLADAPGAGVDHPLLGGQQPVVLQPVRRRVRDAGADLVAVGGEFPGHPCAVDLFFGGVVQGQTEHRAPLEPSVAWPTSGSDEPAPVPAWTSPFAEPRPSTPKRSTREALKDAERLAYGQTGH